MDRLDSTDVLVIGGGLAGAACYGLARLCFCQRRPFHQLEEAGTPAYLLPSSGPAPSRPVGRVGGLRGRLTSLFQPRAGVRVKPLLGAGLLRRVLVGLLPGPLRARGLHHAQRAPEELAPVPGGAAWKPCGI